MYEHLVDLEKVFVNEKSNEHLDKYSYEFIWTKWYEASFEQSVEPSYKYLYEHFYRHLYEHWF